MVTAGCLPQAKMSPPTPKPKEPIAITRHGASLRMNGPASSPVTRTPAAKAEVQAAFGIGELKFLAQIAGDRPGHVEHIDIQR